MFLFLVAFLGIFRISGLMRKTKIIVNMIDRQGGIVVSDLRTVTKGSWFESSR